MKRIKATEIQKLQDAIKAAEGRATARTLTVTKIQAILEKIDSMEIPKTRLSGTKVYYDGAEHFPSAYRYRPESTHFTAENVRGTWYITNISRGTCPNRSTRSGQIVFSEAAQAWILEQASII